MFGNRWRGLFGPAVLACISLPVFAQEIDVGEVVPQEVLPEMDAVEDQSGDPATIDSKPVQICLAETAEDITLHKMTPVILRIDETLGSKISKSGQTFDLTLSEAVMQDGVEVLPAGLSGEGEVIHAKKSGGSGSGGELILAATYIDYEGKQIKLRSMKLGRTGSSNVGLASAVGVSPLGPLGLFIRGKNTQIAAGTLADAKLAEDFSVQVSGQSGPDEVPCLEGST